MGYFRNYRKRGSYYLRRSAYRNSRDDSMIKPIFIFIGSLLLIGFFTSSPGVFIGAIMSLGILFAIIFLIVKIIRKIFGWSGAHSEASISANPGVEDITRINHERHSGRCYANGLSWGEQEVATALSHDLSYKDYYIFNNLIVPATNNGSSQIDHLVISKNGLFVIESKDYKGWIFGSKDQDNWTQSLPGGENKFQFQNPIRQNWSHIMALKELFPTIDQKAFESIVVFTEACEIKTPATEGVLQLTNLTQYIQKFSQERLSAENIELIIGKLSLLCQTVDISSSQHVENLRARYGTND